MLRLGSWDNSSFWFDALNFISNSRESSLADILEGIPPTFSRKPKAKLVPLGSDVELEVRLVAIPEPEIQWFLKNKPVVPSANVTIVTQSDMHMYANTMKISKVTRGQEGVYTVVAKNREGEASVDIILKVRPSFPSYFSIIRLERATNLSMTSLSRSKLENLKRQLSWTWPKMSLSLRVKP